MTSVLKLLMKTHKPQRLTTEVEIPGKLLEAFGECCKDAGLVDSKGLFNDPYKLVKFFCQK